MALWGLWVALPRLSILDFGRSLFDVRCTGPRTVPVRSGSEWAWVLDLLASSCPRGRCEPGRFAVVRLRGQWDRAVKVRFCAVKSCAVSNRNCIAAMRGGEQRNENDQSV